MSRSIDRDELERKEADGSSAPLEGLSRSGSGESRPRTAVETDGPKDFGLNRRELIIVRDREYRVRTSEAEVMRDLGSFRLIREEDLVKGVYRGDMKLAQADIHSLRRQGLIQTVTFQGLDAGGGPTRVHMLTGPGHDLLRARATGPDFWYFGSIKRTEVHHDSLLYRAYLAERSRIESSGGLIKRVILDSELKRRHFAKTNKAGRPYRKVQTESARELHLPVIDGHVAFPDFRLEYEDERGDLGRADIEVATADYRAKHLAMKVAAGFRVYAPSSGGGGLRVDHGHNLKGHAFPRENRMVLPL